MSIKRIHPVTQSRADRIQTSMIKIAVSAKIIQVEYTTEADVKFRKPEVNKFASRIDADAQAVLNQLATGEKLSLKIIGNDYIEAYAGQMYRVFEHFIGMDVQQIAEFMDGLDKIKNELTLNHHVRETETSKG